MAVLHMEAQSLEFLNKIIEVWLKTNEEHEEGKWPTPAPSYSVIGAGD